MSETATAFDDLPGIVLCGQPRCPACKRFVEVVSIHYRVFFFEGVPAEIEGVQGITCRCSLCGDLLLTAGQFDFEWEEEEP